MSPPSLLWASRLVAESGPQVWSLYLLEQALGHNRSVTYPVMPGVVMLLGQCPQVESKGKEGNQDSGTLSFQRDQHESAAAIPVTSELGDISKLAKFDVVSSPGEAAFRQRRCLGFRDLNCAFSLWLLFAVTAAPWTLLGGWGEVPRGFQEC